MPETEDVINPTPKRKLERMLTADGSCYVTESDLQFVALNSNLSLKEVRVHFEDLLQGKIDRKAFKRVLYLLYPFVGLLFLQFEQNLMKYCFRS